MVEHIQTSINSQNRRNYSVVKYEQYKKNQSTKPAINLRQKLQNTMKNYNLESRRWRCV